MDWGVSSAVWEWPGACIPSSPTVRPYPPSGPGRSGGTRVYPPLCGKGSTLCILVLRRGVPNPHAAQTGPEGLGCTRRCVGVGGPCVSSFSHGTSLSPKRPRRDRRDSGASAAVWEGLDLVYPRSPTRRRIIQTAQARPEGLGCIHGSVGLCGPCVSLFPHGATPSSKRPTQDRRERGASSAVWEWLGACIPSFPTGSPYPQSG